MKKLLLILMVALLSCTSAYVQAQCNAPVVTTFSPNTGFIGSTVVITGANFDPIPANNQVFFGSTQATVTAASFGQLTVIVPTGATYGPITVKNGCNLIGSSSYSFNGIFCGTVITAATYNTLTYSINVSGGYQMLSQDMDLDGKPDVLVCGFTTNRVSVMRNLSTPGTFSFAPKFDLVFAGATRCIAPADYDGDGKIDLAVVDNGINGVRIYRNTSVPGTLSFAAPYDVPGIGGYQCAAGDLNNDGKTDIAVGSGNNVVTLRNTSTPGTISFATNTTTVVGGFVTGLVVTDVDGDGIKDIGAANAGANTLHAFRNTTTPGSTTFSFAGLQTFPTGNYPYRLFLGDFDKDGKIDFVNNDFSGGTVSVFRNISTPGTIAFAAKNTLTARSSNYRLGVGDADGDGKPDIVSKSSGENFFSVFVNTSPAPGTIAFNNRIDFADPAEVSGIVIADLDGDFVPDISTSGTSSNALKIFRNNSSVIDNTPPTAICKNIIVPLSPSGTVVVTAAMIDNGSSDACGIGSVQINDAASATFTCANIGANVVTLKVTDRAGNVSTCQATVTVAPAAIIVAGQTTVCQGQTVVLSANQGDSYQWQKDGVDISGATSQTYTATTTGDYTVTVTNAGGCSGTSVATHITVNTNPTVNTSPSGIASLCPPSNSVLISASTSSIYQWIKDGVNISGATQQNYNATAVGTYTVKVIDLFGCSATSSPIVIGATDNVPPTAICKNVTLAVDGNGNASITAASIDNGSFDNCGNVTLAVIGRTSYTCADAGQTFAVTLSVTDAQGNNSTCTAQVTVTDPLSVCNHAPVAVCKAVSLPADANCQATALAAAFDGGSSDVDANDVLTFSVSPAGPYSKGVTNVTFTVTDSKGASSSCSTTVTVYDNTPPVINSANGDISVNNTPGKCGAFVSFARPTASDNCSGSAFNYFNAGEPNNWGGEDYLQLYNSGTWNDLPNMGGLKYIVEINSINTTPIAGYTLIGTFGGHTYFISNGTNNWTGARAAALLTGGDLASINTMAEDLFLAPYGGSTWVGGYQDHSDPSYVEPGNASQNFGGWKWVDGTKLGAGQIAVVQTAGPASGSLFPIGTTLVTWKATDEAGNWSTYTFKVVVRDNELPVISGVPADVTVECNAVPASPNVTVSDNCSATIVYSYSIEHGNCPGNYTINRTWEATDASGNKNSAYQTVTVVDRTAPVLSAKPASVTVECDAVPAAAVVTASDNCDPVPSVVYNEVRTDGASPNDYVLTRTWTATDNCGNATSYTQVVTVQDTKAPVLTVPANVSVNNDAGICGAAITYEATATDNCSPVAITYTSASGTVFPVGTTTVTVTAKDLSGNTTTGSFTITVTDNEAPVTKCKAATVTLVNGAASITAADVNDNSTDNCGIASVVISKSSFNCSNIGANAVTLTITDIYGNTSSCVATVNVVGEIPSCSVASVPTSNVYTGGVSTNLYLGYGAQSTVLKVTPAANGAPYTYSWTGTAVNMLSSTTSGAPVFTPTAAGTYTFTVTTTNVYGCTTTCSISICVTDVKVYSYKDGDDDDDHEGDNSGDGDDDDGDDEHHDGDDAKVYICHTPNGNHENPKTLSISAHAVADHLREHPLDRLGTCGQQPCSAYTDKVNPKISCPKDITINCNGSIAPAATGTATAIDNYSTATVSYTDVTNGNKITRTWKATDAAGNFSTCTQTITVGVFFTTTLSSDPNSNVNTGGVSTNLYLGYGAQSTTLKVGSLPSSGAPYTYSWTGSNLTGANTATPVFTPVTGGTYSFAATITNKYGCSYTSSISICVTDVRVAGTSGATAKVYICHTPKGKNMVATTLQVLVKDVPSHINGGSCGGNGSDRLGTCGQQPCTVATSNAVSTALTAMAKDGSSEVATSEEELKITVMPNPSTTHFTLKLESKYQTPVEMRVMDARGRVIDAKSKIGSNSTIQIGHSYSSGTYFAEMIQGNTRRVVQLIKGKE